MPKLIFQEQQYEFTEEDGPVFVGSDKSCNIVLPETPEVALKTFEIFFDGERYKVKNISKLPLRTNSGGLIPPGQTNNLRPQTLFAFGKNLFVAYHGEAEVKFEPVTVKDPLKNEQELLVSKFYEKVNPDGIEKYLVHFIGTNFRVTTVAVILKEGTRWLNVAEFCAGQKRYRPSITLLRQFAASGKAVKFDIDDNEEGPQSIMQNKVKRAFLIPLAIGNAIEGALYLDSTEGILNEKDFYKIQYLCENGIAALIKARRLAARIDYPIRDKLPKTAFRARLVVRNYPNLTLSVKALENEHRVLLSAAEDPKTATILKIFQDGLYATLNDDQIEDSFFSDIIENRFKTQCCELGVSIKDRKLFCSVNPTEKFFTGISKDGIISEFNLLVGDTEIKHDETLFVSPSPSLVHDFLEISQ